MVLETAAVIIGTLVVALLLWITVDAWPRKNGDRILDLDPGNG